MERHLEPVEFAELVEEEEEEDVEAEEARLRRRRYAAGAVGAVLGFIVAILVVALLVGPNAVPFLNNFDPTPLTSSDLNGPLVPTWSPEFGDEPPVPTGITGPAAVYSIKWTTSNVFVGRGGNMRVNVSNQGTTEIYVERVILRPDWDTGTFATSFGRYVTPGEEVHIGLLGFSGPSAPGTYHYQFEVDLMVRRPVQGTWYDAASNLHDERFELQVQPANPVGGYDLHYNDKGVYRKVNDLIQPDDPRVVSLADRISEGLGDEYNIYWVAALFEYVLEELDYRSDPSDDDIWSPPGDTCDSQEGDCEDFSILIASVVEHWGGNSRFYIITDHAFAGVYLGPAQMDGVQIANALDGFYGTTVMYSWFVDELGYWIIADGTSSQHLGGLPYNGVATDLQGGWDIKNTEYLFTTDIYPDYPE